VAALRHLLGRRFKANPAFEVLGPDQLPESVPGLAGGSGGNATGAALVPRSGGAGTATLLNAEPSDLLRRLQEVGRLPRDVESDGGVMANEAIARLVLDGALAIEDGEQLISGPAAHRAVFKRDDQPRASGRIAAMSLRAVRYAQELMIADVPVLAHRLYGFGAIPRHARWDLLLDSADDVVGLLGLSRGGHAHRLLCGDYEAATDPHWLSWARLGEQSRQPAPLYKLYISPRPEALVDAFPAVVAVLASTEVRSFKVGRGVLGLLRPDKLVAYFADVHHLQHVARALARVLDGCPPHGVPFTTDTGADGLLSWGIDPPPRESLAGALHRESWRYWVTNRLAANVIRAQREAGTVEPWEFALDRLSLEGIDTTTWMAADTRRAPNSP
jgi:hypothetical protein